LKAVYLLDYLDGEHALVLTYANQLTILRMIFIPFIVLFLIYGHPKAATLIFILAAITDGLDGLLARKFQQKTVLGSYLDPIADKLLLTATFVTLTVPSLPLPVHIPIWLTVLTITRDVLIALIALIIHLRTGHSRFPPSLLGKCTTAMQLLTVGICMLSSFYGEFGMKVFPWVVFSALFFTVTSGMHYFYRTMKLLGSYSLMEGKDGAKRTQSN
jgi:cardiolipin synthase (CMP-forming)